jgi:hypothetical protein
MYSLHSIALQLRKNLSLKVPSSINNTPDNREIRIACPTRFLLREVPSL